MKRSLIFLLGLAAMTTSRALNAASAAAESNNKFAFDCLRELGQKPGDVACSPYSAWTALTMTSGGAMKATLKEMAATLHHPEDSTKIHSQAGEWTQQLKSLRGIQLRTANRLWLAPKLELTPSFDLLTKKHYDAGLERAPFDSDPNTARKAINTWVETQTAGRIKDLLQPINVTEETRMVLTNAIYFNASWAQEFNPNDTRPLLFHSASQGEMRAPMMLRKSVVPYFESPDFQAVRLAYTGGDTSMIVVLPAKGKSSSLSDSQFSTLRAGLKEEKITLRLPRFKIEQRVDMAGLLKELGMKTPFNNSADFSGMTLTEPLVIGAVIHQAFVKVGEKGTEAAAATAVTMMPRSAPPRQEEMKEMICDRPFLFFITHDPTGGILFAGRVDHPEEAR